MFESFLLDCASLHPGYILHLEEVKTGERMYKQECESRRLAVAQHLPEVLKERLKDGNS